MQLIEKQCQFTSLLAKLITRANGLGYQLGLREVQRNIETQRKYVEEGRSKTLNSKHLDCLAADLVILKEGAVYTSGELFRPLGEYWEGLGGRWGGRFGLEKEPKEVQDKKLGWDSPHFELRS